MTFWRAGVEYAAGKTPKWDFIPSAAQPAYFTNEQIVGAVPPTDFEGLRVLGSYGDAWLVESHYVPSGYVIVAATGGLDSDRNPIATRSASASTPIPLTPGCAIFPAPTGTPCKTVSTLAGSAQESGTEAQR